MKFKEFITNVLTNIKEEFSKPDALPQDHCRLDNPKAYTNKNPAGAFESWWRKGNAEYYRNQCGIYTNLAFPRNTDLEICFGSSIEKFWSAHGNWRIIDAFPEIHLTFVAVDVFALRGSWDHREIDLKAAVLVELCRAYASFARAKGMDLVAFENFLVTDLWMVKKSLVLEIPNSVFPVSYPAQARQLAPDRYWQLRKVLEQASSL